MFAVFRRFSVVILLVALLLLFTIPACFCAKSKPSLVEESSMAVAPGGECWVFSRMAKTGSSTLTVILQDWYKQNDIQHHGWPTKAWADVDKDRDYLARNSTVVAGAYAETLRAMGGGGQCKWFAIFRHPIPRLVSAFYYCKHKRPGDAPCGHKIIDLDTADFATFAEMWSNMAMRHFIAAFVTPEEVLASPSVQAMGRKIPGWYKIGLYANELYANETANGSAAQQPGVHDAGMWKFLKPAVHRLEHNYAAIGILEDFDRTLLLFDRALEMPGLDWVDSFNNLGTQNEGNSTVKEKSDETLRLAWGDATIHKYVWLDMLLYGHALAVHDKQLAAYGLL